VATRLSAGLTVGLIALTLLAEPHVATAAPITFEFTTTVVSVESAFLGVQAGEPVVGRYTFESTTPPTPPSPPDSRVGRYNPVGTFEVQFGVLKLILPLSHIEVLNRPEIDRYAVAAVSGTGNGAIQLQLALATNLNLGAFTDVGLPLAPPPLNLFEFSQFILYVNHGPNKFVPQITATPIETLRALQVVPELGTATLLIIGFGLSAGWLLRRSP